MACATVRMRLGEDLDRHPQPAEGQHLADDAPHRQPPVLQHRADAAGTDRVARPPAEHPDRAGHRVQQAQDGVDGGGLAGPVGAEQRDGLPGRDDEVEIVDGDRVAVADRQAGDREGRRQGTRRAWPACGDGRSARRRRSRLTSVRRGRRWSAGRGAAHAPAGERSTVPAAPPGSARRTARSAVGPASMRRARRRSRRS